MGNNEGVTPRATRRVSGFLGSSESCPRNPSLWTVFHAREKMVLQRTVESVGTFTVPE
jgi:hypothetical protein